MPSVCGGKEVWKSLRHLISVWPRRKLAEFLREHRKRRGNENGEVSAQMKFSEAASIHLRTLDDNFNIKPRTRDYWREVLAALLKSWRKPRRNRGPNDHPARLQEMGERLRKKGVADSLNNTLAVLRHVLNRRHRRWRNLQQPGNGRDTYGGERQANSHCRQSQNSMP